MTPDYRVRLGRSRLGVALLLVASLASAALALAIDLSPPAQSLAVLWIGLGTLGAYRDTLALCGPRSVREIALRVPREIAVRDARGRVRLGTLRDGSFVAPWLTIIRWRPHGALLDRTLLVLPDMLESDAFRRLRICLKWM